MFVCLCDNVHVRIGVRVGPYVGQYEQRELRGGGCKYVRMNPPHPGGDGYLWCEADSVQLVIIPSVAEGEGRGAITKTPLQAAKSSKAPPTHL